LAVKKIERIIETMIFTDTEVFGLPVVWMVEGSSQFDTNPKMEYPVE
jgi:hypothetical protein